MEEISPPSSMIEFGDFETQLDQVAFSHDKCVELPPSWPVDYKKTLSFHLPKSGLPPGANVDNVATKKADVNTLINGDEALNEHVEVSHQDGAVEETTAPDVKAPQEEEEEECVVNGFHDVAEDQEDEATAPSSVVENTSSPPVQDDTVSSSTKEEPLPSISDQPSPTEEEDVAVEENETSNQDDVADSSVDNEVDTPVSDAPPVVVQDKDNAVAADAPKKIDEPVKPKSWAGLFKSSSSTATAAKVETKQTENRNATNSKTIPIAKYPMQQQTNNDANDNKRTPTTARSSNTQQVRFETDKVSLKDVDYVKVEDDPIAEYLAGCLHDLELIYKPQAFIPRGLINTSNWCFINATLQALLVCPPFYQLLRQMEAHVQPETRRFTSTPILDSFCILASEFRQLTTNKRGGQQSQQKVDIPHGAPFEPHYIYEMLTVIKSTLSEHGRQEDAEEFQSCILNGLHDEIIQLFNYAETSSSNQQQVQTNGHHHHSSSDSEGIVEEWEEVVTTKKNRSAVTRRSDTAKTPISEMFRGELCTTVFRVGQKTSVSYEAFFSLPLDVQLERTVEDALVSLTNKETFVDGLDSSSDPSRQQTIETLPPVLILHLKRFVYDKLGGSKKIDKKLEYKTDLIIDRELLSKNAKKLPLAKRTYKLFAVVYHHGEKSTGGHYTTDVFHIGLSSWLRIDDQSIKQVKNNDVTRHHPSRTAYLLYYRRTDLG